MLDKIIGLLLSICFVVNVGFAVLACSLCYWISTKFSVVPLQRDDLVGLPQLLTITGEMNSIGAP